MDAEYRIAREFIEQPVLHHGTRAGVAAFLGRLEDEHHRSIEIAMRGQVLRRPQQHGRVPIVATAVHASTDGRFVGKSIVFGHGQRIHVGTQADSLLAAPGAQNADHTSFPQPGVDFQSPAAQALRNQRGRARLLESQLGMRMDIPSQRGEVAVGAFDFVYGFHGCG